MQTIANDSTHSPAWALPKGKAQTFYANRDGVLHVQSGRAWVTLTTSPCNPQARWCPELDPGDQFVGSGNHLTLRAGQRVVIESWPSSAETNTLLQWQSAPLSASAEHWQARVVQPLREAGLAMLQVARAMVRLLVAVQKRA